MTSAGSFLGRLVAALDLAGVPHMVAGSFASTYHGVPRTTQDIDLVIEPTLQSLRDLLAALPDERYYVDATTAEQALRRRGQFNIIDLETAWKMDLIVRKNRPFSIEEFGRRQAAEILGVKTFIATPEDTVISKLEWAMASESERQLRDVAGVVAVAGADLDIEYTVRWVEELGLAAVWAKAQALAAPGG